MAVAATVAATVLTHATARDLLPWLPSPSQDPNIGTVALTLDLLAMTAVSVATQPRAAAPVPWSQLATRRIGG